MKVGIPHLYFHSEIYKKYGKEISESDLKFAISKWNIPKKVIPLIIKEMELLGLIKKEKRNLIILKNPLFNKEDCNFYYEKLQIF